MIQVGIGMFEMRVESMFHIAGQGTVLAGRIQSGTVNVGDAIEVRSSAQSTRSVVAGIEADHKALRSARAGDRVAVLLKQFAPDLVSGGLRRVGEPPVWQVVDLALYGLPKPWWKFW